MQEAHLVVSSSKQWPGSSHFSSFEWLRWELSEKPCVRSTVCLVLTERTVGQGLARAHELRKSWILQAAKSSRHPERPCAAGLGEKGGFQGSIELLGGLKAMALVPVAL